MNGLPNTGARVVLLLSLLAAAACSNPAAEPPETGSSPGPKRSKAPVSAATKTPAAATPTPTATVTPSGKGTATPTPKTDATPTPTPTPAGTATPTTTGTATPTTTGTATPTPVPVATATPTPAATIAPLANLQVTTVAGDDLPLLKDGDGSIAQFNGPTAVVVDAAGNLLIADSQNNAIRKITFAGATATVSTYAGDKTAGASGDADNADPLLARFNYPAGLALAANGDLYVADAANHRIRKIAAGATAGVAGAVSTVAGSTSGSKSDVGVAAQFNSPTGLVLDGTALYVADRGNNQVRKVDLTGFAVSLLAGDAAGLIGYKNDPDATKALFNAPVAVGIDATRKLYVIDQSNHRIRMIDLLAATKAVTTFAGPADTVTTDSNGFADGGGDPRAAKFDFRAGGGLAVTPDGTIYIADSANQRIRRYSTAAGISSLAGDGSRFDATNPNLLRGKFRDGPAVGEATAVAQFDRPLGVALAADGSLYVADQGNNRIRKVK